MIDLRVRSNVVNLISYFQNDFLPQFSLAYQNRLQGIIDAGNPITPAVLGSTQVQLNVGPYTKITFNGSGFSIVASSTTELNQKFADLSSSIEALDGKAIGTLSSIEVTDHGLTLLKLTISSTKWELTSGTDKITMEGHLPTSLQQADAVAAALASGGTNLFSLLSQFDISKLSAYSDNVQKASISMSPGLFEATAGNYDFVINGAFPPSFAQIYKIINEDAVTAAAYSITSAHLKDISTNTSLLDLTGTGLTFADLLKYTGTDGNDYYEMASPDYHLNLSSGPGNDTFVLADRPSTGNVSEISGGDGIDTVSFANSPEAIKYVLQNYASYIDGLQHSYGYVFYNSMWTYASEDMENVTGGAFNDTISGNDMANTLSGGEGADTLTGGSGADSLSGDGGNDSLAGGDGDDVIVGGTGNDVLFGGVGNDRLDGTNGIDTARFSATYAQSTIFKNQNGSYTISSALDGSDNLMNIDYAEFSDQRVTLTLAIAGTPRDFNGDAKSDILLQNGKDGAAYIWALNNKTLVDNGFVGWAPGADWKAKGTGDFNGDGKSDILLQNVKDGSCYIWELNNKTLVDSGFVGWIPGADWQAKGTGDFNGDGKSDILLQNVKDGSCYIWELNNKTLVDNGFVGWIPGSDWQATA